MQRKLRIAIDCRIANHQQGVGTALLALAKALSDSQVDSQEYTFIVREDAQSWLAPYVYGPCKLAVIPASRFSILKNALRPIAPLQFIWRRLRGKVTRIRFSASLPVSDGFVESHKFDLVHFPDPFAYVTNLPSIYQPWDLQHLHYPEFFSQVDRALREIYYPAFCSRASSVCVQAEWTKHDVINQYGIPEDKVVVIPWGSVFDAYKRPSIIAERAVKQKFGFPSTFFFYPAATWPHKNHKVIFHALDILKRQRGTPPQVYFTGLSTDYRSTLDKLARELGISDYVHFLGFLSAEELQTVFSSATAMIFPSKFEGFGLPILEAFHANLPVLSSNATVLPEVAGEAALYFDPDSPEELAALMNRILDSSELRRDLICKGALVLSRHSIDQTAANFQALYEKVALSSKKNHDPSPTSI